jgi:hypothetical protein
MVGQRINPESARFGTVGTPKAGDYWLSATGWMGITPNGLRTNLKGHKVSEHPNGTISVEPSIEVSDGDGGLRWHGFLRNGVWEEC